MKKTGFKFELGDCPPALRDHQSENDKRKIEEDWYTRSNSLLLLHAKRQQEQVSAVPSETLMKIHLCEKET